MVVVCVSCMSVYLCIEGDEESGQSMNADDIVSSKNEELDVLQFYPLDVCICGDGDVRAYCMIPIYSVQYRAALMHTCNDIHAHEYDAVMYIYIYIGQGCLEERAW